MTGLEEAAVAAVPKVAEEGGKELAKSLSHLLGHIYDDALSPSAKQLGGAIEDIVKTARLLAWPLQFGAVFQDRFRGDLTKAMEKVKPEDRQIPPLKLFADCCEGSKFETEDVLRDMWGQLLSRGCDKTRVGEAHPAFPGLIRQMSVDEALLLTALMPIQPRPEPFDIPIPYIDTKGIGIHYTDNLSFYLGHLASLGLLVIPTGFMPTAYQVIIDQIWTFMLTDFGRSFMSAVTETE